MRTVAVPTHRAIFDVVSPSQDDSLYCLSGYRSLHQSWKLHTCAYIQQNPTSVLQVFYPFNPSPTQSEGFSLQAYRQAQLCRPCSSETHQMSDAAAQVTISASTSASVGPTLAQNLYRSISENARSEIAASLSSSYSDVGSWTHSGQLPVVYHERYNISFGGGYVSTMSISELYCQTNTTASTLSTSNKNMYANITYGSRCW